MTKAKPLPPAEVIRAEFNYDPATGHLSYAKPRQSVNAGQEVISSNVAVKPSGQRYVRTRVIWCWMTGEDPGEFLIDHKNGNNTDDRWENLRKATPQQNMYNRRGFGRYPKGVSFLKTNINKPWRAVIMNNGESIRLGYFATMKEACKAYEVAEKKVHGDFSVKLRPQQKAAQL